MTRAAELPEGAVLGGRYRVVRALGRGGMATVYHAIQDGLARPVAVKVLHPERATPAGIERFVAEARAAASLGHPNIIGVSEVQVDGDRCFLVMELLDGASLGALIARGPLVPARLAVIAIQALAGLEAAHAAGIVHRDVKPDNVFVCASSGVADLTKLLDFGIAKLAVDAAATGDGVVGTIDYLAPEQAAGGAVDARTDVYGVGATLFAALTGRPPHVGPSVLARLDRILHDDAPPIASLCEVPAALAQVVDRALQREPAARFASARAMAEALAAAIAPGAAADEAAPAASEPAPRRWRWAALAAAAAAIAISAALAWPRAQEAEPTGPSTAEASRTETAVPTTAGARNTEPTGPTIVGAHNAEPRKIAPAVPMAVARKSEPAVPITVVAETTRDADSLTLALAARAGALATCLHDGDLQAQPAFALFAILSVRADGTVASARDAEYRLLSQRPRLDPRTLPCVLDALSGARFAPQPSPFEFSVLIRVGPPSG